MTHRILSFKHRGPERVKVKFNRLGRVELAVIVKGAVGQRVKVMVLGGHRVLWLKPEEYEEVK